MWALIIALIIIGVILLVTELIIIPGFGVTGILGIAAMVTSCCLAWYKFGHVAGTWIIVINVAAILILLFLLLRTQTWKRASLQTNINAKVDEDPRKKGIKVGMKGMSLTRLAPGGQARIGENNVEVFTRGQLVDACKELEVTDIEGTKVFVRESGEERKIKNIN